jgi:hypothetical protein
MRAILINSHLHHICHRIYPSCAMTVGASPVARQLAALGPTLLVPIHLTDTSPLRCLRSRCRRPVVLNRYARTRASWPICVPTCRPQRPPHQQSAPDSPENPPHNSPYVAWGPLALLCIFLTQPQGANLGPQLQRRDRLLLQLFRIIVAMRK